MDQPEWRLFSIREARSLVREWGPLRREQLRHRVLCRRFWLRSVETRLEQDTRHAGLRWKAGPPGPFRRSRPSGVRRLVAHPLGPVLPMKLRERSWSGPGLESVERAGDSWAGGGQAGGGGVGPPVSRSFGCGGAHGRLLISRDGGRPWASAQPASGNSRMKHKGSATSAAVGSARSRGRAHRDHQGERLREGDAGADANV